MGASRVQLSEAGRAARYANSVIKDACVTACLGPHRYLGSCEAPLAWGRGREVVQCLWWVGEGTAECDAVGGDR